MALAVLAAGGGPAGLRHGRQIAAVGFAVDAGIRAATLEAPARPPMPRPVDAWLALVGGDPAAVDPAGAPVPDGLAVTRCDQTHITRLKGIAGLGWLVEDEKAGTGWFCLVRHRWSARWVARW